MPDHDHPHDHVHPLGHGHPHDHGHPGDHDRRTTHGGAAHLVYSSRPHPEHVVLELGEEVGALIVHTDPGLLGVEVEISPIDDDDARSHKEVLQRVSAAGSDYVLVFDGLAEGAYCLWLDGRARSRGVQVQGGEIAELDWRNGAGAGLEGAMVTSNA